MKIEQIRFLKFWLEQESGLLIDTDVTVWGEYVDKAEISKGLCRYFRFAKHY